MFDESSTSFGKCGFPFSVDCTGRREASLTGRTRRLRGFLLQAGRISSPPSPVLAVPGPTVTSLTRTRRSATSSTSALTAWPTPRPVQAASSSTPAEGSATTLTRARGELRAESRPCRVPVLAVPSDNQELFRPGCTSSALYEFSCPASSPHEHTRHAHPENCDQFYLCIAGRARRQSCSPGLVFNPVSLSCEGQETVEGPCSRFYNESFMASLTTPAPLSPALSANRLASQDRRRPVRPARPLNRQPQPQPQLPPEQIPQQLLDLQNFGQSSPVRNRGPPSLPRRQQDPFQSGRVQLEEKESFFNNLRGSINQARDQQPARTFTRPPLRRPAGAAAPVEEDTPRFVAAPTPAPSSDSGFGRRRQPLRQRQRTQTTDILSKVEAEILRRDREEEEEQLRREEELLRREEELLRRDEELLRREQQKKEVQEELLRREQQQREVQAELLRREQQQKEVQEELLRREQQKKEVEAELLRREQQQKEVEAELARRREQEAGANLGPAGLDSLLSRRRPARPSRVGLRRAPVSRGGVGLQQRGQAGGGGEARGGEARGRLEVLDIRRPPLQPQPGEDQTDFETNFNSFRQRNSG